MKSRNKLIELYHKIKHVSEIEISREFLIEINSDGHMKVFGAKDVISYDNDSVVFRCKDFLLSVKGQKFNLYEYSEAGTTLHGKIDEIKFIRKE